MTLITEAPTWSLVLADGSELPLTTQEGVTVDQVQGAGMPPIANLTTPYALLDGAAWQRAAAQPRVVTLVLRAVGGTAAGLARVRRALIGAVSPHRGALPLALRHYGPDGVRELAAYYDAGLEGGGHTGWSEEIGLRLLAVDPYWYGAEEEAALDPSDSLAVSGIAARRSEGWDGLGGGLVPSYGYVAVNAIAQTLDGDLLVGGGLAEDAGGNPMHYLARWNGMAWAPFAADEPDAVVSAVVVDAAGNVYIGGSFTHIGAAAFGYVAMWDGATWHNLGGGMDSDVYALIVGPDGSVYAGGSFTTAGGSARARVARWDGSTWQALGTGFPANFVGVLAMGADGSVYAGGQFSKIGGAMADYIARWNGSDWEELAEGLNGWVITLAVAPNGDLYAGGSFTMAGSTPVSRVARWDGDAWHPLGAGLDGQVGSLTFGPDGRMYAGGAFTAAGDLPLTQRMAIWNGYSWLHMDAYLPYSVVPPAPPYISTLHFVRNTLYVAFSTNGTALASGFTTITNPGNARVHPVVTVTAAGGQVTLRSLANETTGQRMGLDLTVLAGETITIDTRPGSAGLCSDYRGTALGANPLAGSQLASFVLEPGENTVSLFADETPGGTATAQVRFRPAYWSTD